MSKIGKYGLWIWLISYHILFFLAQLYLNQYLLKDSHEYILAAKNLIEHSILFSGPLEEPLRMDFYTKRPPVYPLILIPFTYFSLHWSILAFLQSLISLFNLGLVLRLAESINGRITKQGKIFFILLTLIYPAQGIYANQVMTELIFQSFILLSFFFYLQLLSYKSGKFLLYSMGFVLLALFTKPVWYLFPLVFFILISYWGIRWKKYFFLALGLIPVVIVWGYMQYNQSVTGYRHYSSIQNLSLFQYTTHNLMVDQMGEESAEQYMDSVLYQALSLGSYEEEQRFISAFCLSTIKAHPGPYAKMHMKGMLNFMLDPGRFDLFHFLKLKEPAQGLLSTFSQSGYSGIWQSMKSQQWWIVIILLLIIAGNLLKLAGLLYFLFMRKIPLQIRFAILVWTGYLIVLTGTSGASRFAVPLFPLLLLVSIISFEKLKQKVGGWNGRN